MNITQSISESLNIESKIKLLNNKAIQIYANQYTDKYQWRDSNQEETADQFNNKKFDTRIELVKFLTEYLKRY